MPTSLPLQPAIKRLPLGRFLLHPVSVAACLLGAAPASFGLPQGALPTFGQVAVKQTDPLQLSIQQGSQRAGIDWTTFSIGSNERVVISQPNRSSVLLNRVVGNDPSQILGNLQSNGTVWLINPRGIVFGVNSRVDVGSLVASTLSISNEDLVSGRLLLSRLGGSAGGTEGEIRSEGRINAPDGTVALVAPQLTQSGRIIARRIGLAAATEVQLDLDGDGLIFFNARNDGSLAARLNQIGSLQANGGSIELSAAARAGMADTVLNLEGVVQARSIGKREGRIVIDGGTDGVTRVAGTVDASGGAAGDHGGEIKVLGSRVWLDSSARLDASGDAGGGSVLVGGNWQGHGPERNALVSWVSLGATLNASAVRLGDGGKVVVWADGLTVFDGSISARGGLLGGNGGRVETSGKSNLAVRSGSVDAGASAGSSAGLWLLDPDNITVATGGLAAIGDVSTVNAKPGSDQTIAPATLVAANADIVLQAKSDITISNAVTLTAVGKSFTAQAGQSITVAAAISTNNGAITLSANDSIKSGNSTTGKVVLNADLNAGTAAVVITNNATGTDTHQLGAQITGGSLTLTGNAQLTATTTLALSGNSVVASVLSGVGGLTVNGAGTLTLSGANTYAGKTSIQNGALSAGSLNNVLAGAASSNLGAPTSVAAGTIDLGSGTTAGTLLYTGSGQTTDRVINLAGTTGGGTLDQSGTGLLKFSSALTATGAGSKTLTLQGSTAGTGELGGAVVDGSGPTTTALSKAGSGTWTLAGANSYTGATTVSAGTLALGAANRLADASTLVVSGGTFDLGGFSDSVAGVRQTAGLVANGTLTSLSAFDMQAGTASAVLAGSAGLNKSSAGTVMLSGANSYTGATTVAAGTLALSANDTLPSSTAVVVNGATAVLDIGIRSNTVAAVSLQGGGTVQGSSGVLSSSSTFDLQDGSVSAILAGPVGLSKTTGGNVSLSGANIYSGATSITAGTLTLGANDTLPGRSAVTIDGATAVLAIGARNNTVAAVSLLGNGVITGSSGVLTSTLAFDLQSGAARAILDGTAGLNKSGAGNVVLEAANRYSGATTVSAGTLTLGANDVLPTGTAVKVTGASSVLDIANRSNTVASVSLQDSGAINGSSGVLTSSAAFDVQSGNVGAILGGVAGLDKTGTGSVVLSGANRYTGVTRVSAGTLSLGAADRLAPAGTLEVSGGLLDLGGFSNTLAGVKQTGGTVSHGTLSSTSAFDMQAGGVSAVLGGAVGLNKTGPGTVALSGANTYTGITTVSAGELQLDGAGRLLATGLADVATGATLRLNGDQSLAGLTLAGLLTGHGVLSASSYTFNGGRVEVPLGSGALTSTGATVINNSVGADAVTVASGTLTLGSANLLLDTAAVTVAGSATLAMAGNDTVGSLLLRGTLAGAGTLTAQTYALDSGAVRAQLGTGALSSSGASVLDRPAGVGSVNVLTGTLTIGAADLLTALPAVTVTSGATLALGGAARIGTLSGGGTLALGAATLSTGAGGSSVFSGTVAGTGGLIKQGADSFTLAGANRYTGDTTVQAGNLVLSGDNRLSDATAVSVATGATLTLAGTDKVRSLQLAGTLAGAGTLTAADYALTGGTVEANLGTGALLSSGASLIKGLAQLDSVTVHAGTLSLGLAGRLTANPAVSVDAGATLALGGNETLGTLAGSGGVVLGGATLSTGVTGSSTFAGDISGSGGLSKLGASTFTLSGANTYAGATTVVAGTLALAAPSRLADTSAVTVAPAATLALGGDQTVASLALQGTLGGSGTLTAASYALNGGSTGAQANLGTGRLRSTGTSTLAGTVAAGTVDVDGGRLVLASAARLADGSTLTVAGGATLSLTGDNRVGSVVLRGTVDGSGTLSAATYLVDGGAALADLGTGSLTSTGASTLTGRSAASTLAVDAGLLTLSAGGRLSAAPAVSVAPGAGLLIGGDDSFGSLSGAGSVALGSATLSTGAGGSSSFSGAISGLGNIVKRGASTTFTLTGASPYSGSTTVAEGTLSIGDGGTSGTLATSNFAVQGVLRSARSDNVVINQPISGSGSVEQAGSGRLTMQGNNKTYTGRTVVTRGELASAGSENLSDGSDLAVAAGAKLILAGDETVKSVDADGTVAIASRLTTTGAMALRGAVTATGGAAVTLTGQQIDAVNAGNLWGSSLSVNSTGVLNLSAGKDGANFRDLTLGTFNVSGGGRVDAGAVALSGLVTIAGPTLVIDASKAATLVLPDAALTGKLTPAKRQIGFSKDVVTQTDTSRIEVAAGGLLSIVASKGGSVALLNATNRFGGGLAVRSGDATSPWAANLVNDPTGATSIQYSMQSRIQVAGTQVNVGGAGFEADVVRIKADSVSTPGNAVIVARLPYENLEGTLTSLPGLTFELTPAAFLTPFTYGQGGNEININVGNKAWGPRTQLLVDSGYFSVLPRGAARGATALFLKGPLVAGTFGFFYDGAGQQSEVPLFYNGVSAVTPQVAGSISSTVSVSEGARKERFEEAIRTENVAIRLRSGVIAEVGPGTPATSSTVPLDPMRPVICPPAGGTLGCATTP